jgi:hypothetical protein
MAYQTTIQVHNYYKSNLVELNLEEVAASAPKRSPTPDLSRNGWKEVTVPQYPGSGIMSPVAAAKSRPLLDEVPTPRIPSPLRVRLTERTSSSSWLDMRSDANTSGIRSSLTESPPQSSHPHETAVTSSQPYLPLPTSPQIDRFLTRSPLASAQFTKKPIFVKLPD